MTTNQIAISALLSPIVPNHVEVAAFAFGVRALVNTVMVVGECDICKSMLTPPVQIVPAFFFIVRNFARAAELTFADGSAQRALCAIRLERADMLVMMGLFQRLSLRTNMVLRIGILLAFAVVSGLKCAAKVTRR